jgi:hypothetical protein
MNDIWEDLIALAVIVLALAAYLILLNTLLTNQMIQSAAAEKYRRAQLTAGYLAVQWAYGPETGVIDPAKACSSCPQTVSVAVYDLRKKQKICECNPGAAGAVVRLPAAVRYDHADTAPAELEVTVR